MNEGDLGMLQMAELTLLITVIVIPTLVAFVSQREVAEVAQKSGFPTQPPAMRYALWICMAAFAFCGIRQRDSIMPGEKAVLLLVAVLVIAASLVVVLRADRQWRTTLSGDQVLVVQSTHQKWRRRCLFITLIPIGLFVLPVGALAAVDWFMSRGH